MKHQIKVVLLTVLSFILAGCTASNGTGLTGSITAVGSSALLPLVEVASQHFQAIHKDVYVNVQGGGSGQGISQILNGTVEIGNSDIFAEEKKVDVTKYDIKDNKVAIVGIGPIVNLKAKVSNVTTEQLQQIFQGNIKNWKEVGGADLPIIVINRANGSGSRKTFEQFGLKGIEPMTAQEQDNTGTVRKLVKDTDGAISYVAFSYFDETQYKSLAIDGVTPTVANVETNDWKIWAYEHMYTASQPDKITAAFIDFMFTDVVQNEIIPELGYIPVLNMKIDRDAKGNIKLIKAANE